MEKVIEFLNVGGGKEMVNFLIALVVMNALDFFTGVLKGLYNHDFTSRRAKEGLIRKIGVLAVVCGCGVLDFIVPVETGGALFKVASVGFTIVEVSSVVENVAATGVPIPEKITQCLSALDQKHDVKKDGEGNDDC